MPIGPARMPLMDHIGELRRSFDVNTVGPVIVAKCFYPHMKKGGKVFTVTSEGVGIRSCGTAESGLGNYLGETYDEETAAWRAQYGRKLELVVALDAYSPAGAGQEGCCAALERAHDLLTGQPVSGLRFGEMDWGEVRFDRDTGMFLRQGSLRCSAFLVAAVEEESGLLLDFRLKGVPLL